MEWRCAQRDFNRFRIGEELKEEERETDDVRKTCTGDSQLGVSSGVHDHDLSPGLDRPHILSTENVCFCKN